MIIREYQKEELARARKLQQELGTLHVPCPILSWEYELRDVNGNIKEKGTGKANSYTRNGLNVMAWMCGSAASANQSAAAVGNGLVSLKMEDGTIWNSTAPGQTYPLISSLRRSNTDNGLILGTSNAEESLDDYLIVDAQGTFTSSVTLSSFDSITNKLVTVLSRVYVNSTTETVNICEAGVRQNYSANRDTVFKWFLIVRDMFTPIPVGVGESLQWNYVFEVVYPQ